MKFGERNLNLTRQKGKFEVKICGFLDKMGQNLDMKVFKGILRIIAWFVGVAYKIYLPSPLCLP